MDSAQPAHAPLSGPLSLTAEGVTARQRAHPQAPVWVQGPRGGAVRAGLGKRRHRAVCSEAKAGAAAPLGVIVNKGLRPAHRACDPHAGSLTSLPSGSISYVSLFVWMSPSCLASNPGDGCGAKLPCACMSGHPRWLSCHQASPQCSLLSSGDGRRQAGVSLILGDPGFLPTVTSPAFRPIASLWRCPEPCGVLGSSSGFHPLVVGGNLSQQTKMSPGIAHVPQGHSDSGGEPTTGRW